VARRARDAGGRMTALAWGAHVSPIFAKGVIGMSRRLAVPDPSYLMSCMAFETGETFSPSIRNAAGSGAVGLIQFMPQTAHLLGTTTEDLVAMTAENQLMFVETYFKPRAGKLKTLGDVYGAILWPAMIGKPDDAIVFNKDDVQRPKLYVQNKGLDLNKDGHITRGEIVALVQAKMAKGLLQQNKIEVDG
jgi:hypothetical protein